MTIPGGWHRLPRATRVEAVQLAGAELAHPDPAVQAAAYGRQLRQHRRTRRLMWTAAGLAVSATVSLAMALWRPAPLIWVGAALGIAAMSIGLIAPGFQLAAQARTRLAVPHLRAVLPSLPTTQPPLRVMPAGWRAPLPLCNIALALLWSAAFVFMLVRWGDDALVRWMLAVGLALSLLDVVLSVAAVGMGRPHLMLAEMDRDGIRLPSYGMSLSWHDIAAVDVTAPGVAALIGVPMGLALKLRDPDAAVAASALRGRRRSKLSIALRRQHGWLFFSQEQMRAPLDAVAATANQLHSRATSPI